MPDKISAFRTMEGAERFLTRYDEVVGSRWPIAHEELDLPTRFGQTRVRRSGAGSGVPLVMLHPTTGSSAGWYPVIELFCRDRVVYTPDTMGAAGRSVQTAPIRSETDLADWLDDVLDHLGMPEVHLLGYSEGGWIAGLHAAQTGKPGRLRSLTLIEPAGALERVPAKFLLSMVGGAVRVLVARDKGRSRSSPERWDERHRLRADRRPDFSAARLDDVVPTAPAPTEPTDRRATPPHRTPKPAAPGTTIPAARSPSSHQARHLAHAQHHRQGHPGTGHGLLDQEPKAVSTHVHDFLTAQER